MRVDLNLATRPFVNRAPHLVIVGVLAAAAFGSTAWNVSSYLRSRAAQRTAASQLQELKDEEKGLEARRKVAEDRLAKADLAPLTMRAQAANSVLAQKAISWSLLLERLEELLPWNAALRNIGTKVGPDGVKIDLIVRAKTYEDALSLIETMEASPCFSDVYPHTDLNTKATQSDFEMSIGASHDPYCGESPAAGHKVKLGLGKRGGRG